MTTCMIPLKISNLFDRPPPAAGYVAPTRARTPLAESPKLIAIQPVSPDQDRRVMGKRRTGERREKEQALFLDTRTSGRRRNNGRRAEDRQEAPSTYQAISIHA